jgi:type IV secretory pathway ATPase VirB11/archaellum biosynthesis ATPase
VKIVPKAPIRKILDRALTVSKDELETTYIIQGRPLSDVIDMLGVLKPKVVNISEKGNELGFYVPPRPMHEVPPLAHIAQPLGFEVWVHFYDINGIPVYYIAEPPIDDVGVKFYVYLRQRVGELGVTKASDLVSLAKESLENLGLDSRLAFNDEVIKASIYYVFRDMLGYGPLEIPMEDTYVEEVSWFAYDGPVEVVDKKVSDVYPNSEFIPTNLFFEQDLPDLQKKFFMTQVVRAVTAKARVGLTTARPLAEARIPDPTGRGFHRLAAHLDITSRSPAITIRKFPHKKLSITELVKFGTLSSFEAAYLIWQLINRGFILIVGGMASGKTTLLQALISALPVSYKVVTIEDTPELSTPAQNWHPLYVRRAPKESELEDVSFSRLVIHSLRHRGTIVTLGEVRGAEMADLIQAAASGHGAICLPPETPVLARSVGGEPEVTTIKDIVERYENGEDIEVYSYNKDRGVFEWRRVTGSIRVLTDLWVKIETESGRRLKMTPDHRVPILNPVTNEIEIVEAKDLRIGDMIPIAGKVERNKVLYHFTCCNVYISLSSDIARIFGEVLKQGKKKTYSIPERYEKTLKSLPIRIPYDKKRGTLRITSNVFKTLISRIIHTIKENPFSLPHYFLEALANTILNEQIVIDDTDFLYKLHYALKIIGYDSVVDTENKAVTVTGKRMEPIFFEQITSVETEQSLYDEAYDIEVEGNHTFVTGDSIITGNCTFHAHDPESVLARITSPPINAAPESLKLITSIVHIAKTKTYARGKPESVRRVIRIFEIADVKGKEIKASETFKWNPMTDKHIPSLTDEGLIELWKTSGTVRTLGLNLYVDEAPRALVELMVLAKYLDFLIKHEVFDIKEVVFRMTTLYLRIDKMVDKLWREKYKSLLMPLMQS